MHVIRPDVPFQDHDVMRLANLSNDVAQTRPDLSSKDRLAVLWDEHEVVVALINAMRPVTVCAHGIPKYRKPPEGFA
jgi:hypothetical protein